ncbi:hypothetical protein CTI12_AA491980 [Artemisia annua]|uniref:Uncharacterized protein n=1 Tax=Artemisia annua TaxID=35608 RepID=A0A2U1LBA0_ARTAN|nr:hypothetical protein CTI12_AA491980 [Artemisia annua]
MKWLLLLLALLIASSAILGVEGRVARKDLALQARATVALEEVVLRQGRLQDRMQDPMLDQDTEVAIKCGCSHMML